MPWVIARFTSANEVQAPVYKAALHVDIPPGAEKPMSEAELRDPVKHGFYQVTIAWSAIRPK
jgi:hypothetical protein